MEMEFDREILAYINQNDGQVGFYQVVRRFGVRDANVDLPEIVRRLIESNLIAATPNGGSGTQDLYVLTKKGRDVLGS